MDIVFKSFLLVAASEMGDKTQLLALVLASRFRKPWTVMAGVLVATILNHLLAAMVGNHLAALISPDHLKAILAAIFIGFAFWILIPDKDEELKDSGRFGAFFTTVISFFLAEMGDKTQLATVALAAEFQNIGLVTLGTTLGMMFSDGLAVVFGEAITAKISMKWVRWIAAALFFAFGLGIWFGF